MTNIRIESTNLFTVSDDRQTLKKYQVSSFAEIWESKETGAKSLHATKEFLPGEVISEIKIKEYVDKPSYLSVQINETQHIMLAPEHLQYINHSCEPNVFFDTSNMMVSCLKKIKIGEAMTFFYPSTEWSMTQSFDCLCGEEQCLGEIQGGSQLSPDILQNYRLNEHIKTKKFK